LTPVKVQTQTNYTVVSPAILNNPDNTWYDRDLRELVVESFWKHGKQLRQQDLIKVTNTELLLRYVKMSSIQRGWEFK
jgi:hypothetical protein